MTIPKLTLLSSLHLTLIKLQSKTWGKLDLDIIFWYIQSLSKLYLNPICLTFCSVTWSIFDVGRKVRWVLESSSPGLLKNGKILLCKSSGSWENNQNKVNTQLWDTLYIQIFLDYSRNQILLYCWKCLECSDMKCLSWWSGGFKSVCVKLQIELILKH